MIWIIWIIEEKIVEIKNDNLFEVFVLILYGDLF